MVEGDGERAKRLMRLVAAWSGAMALVMGGFVSTPAVASDQGWACEVALCASNPGGWMEFAQCVPPIEKLITHLALGGSFPICIGGGFKGAKYTKPNHGNPGHVLFTMTDGSQRYYAVPSQNDVTAAEQSVGQSVSR